jgi:hypothetical protein
MCVGEGELGVCVGYLVGNSVGGVGAGDVGDLVTTVTLFVTTTVFTITFVPFASTNVMFGACATVVEESVEFNCVGG